MNIKKFGLPRLLEIVTAGAFLLIAFISVVSTAVSPFLQNKYNTSAILLLLSIGIANILLVLSPLVVIAVIVLSQSLHKYSKRKLLSVMVSVYGIGSILVSLVTSFLTVFSRINMYSVMSSENIKHQILLKNVLNIGTSILGSVLTIIMVLFVLDSIWKKIKWKSLFVLMTVIWMLIVLNFLNGISIGVYTVFLILVGIFLRDDSDINSEPVIGGYIGSFITVGLSLLSFIISSIHNILQTIAINGDSYRDFEKSLYALKAINKGFDILVFLVALTIPLIILGKRLSQNEITDDK